MKHAPSLALVAAVVLSACSPSSAGVPDDPATPPISVADPVSEPPGSTDGARESVEAGLDATPAVAGGSPDCRFLHAFLDTMVAASEAPTADPAAPEHDPLSLFVALVDASAAALETAPPATQPVLEDLGRQSAEILATTRALLAGDGRTGAERAEAERADVVLEAFARTAERFEDRIDGWMDDYCTPADRRRLAAL